MNQIEALKEIEQRHKPYTYANPIMSQAYYSEMRKRIIEGRVKIRTLEKFFQRFGYSVNVDVWTL